MASRSLTCPHSRRTFIKSASLAGAGLALESLDAGAAWKNIPEAEVSFTAGSDRRQNIIDILTPFKDKIASDIQDRQVVIKCNFVLNDVPLCGTHPDAVRGVLDFLKPIYDKTVVVAEATSSETGTFVAFENYGYMDIPDTYDARLVDLNEQATTDHYILGNDLKPLKIRIVNTFLDRKNYIISVTRLKSHWDVGVTLSIKNIAMGAPINDYKTFNNKPLMHQGDGIRGINENIYRVAHSVRADLSILDGFEGMEGNGPIRGTPVDHRVALAGFDMMAVDRMGCELMGVDLADVGYLTWLARSCYGQADREKITIIGDRDPKDHIITYKMSDNHDKVMEWKKG